MHLYYVSDKKETCLIAAQSTYKLAGCSHGQPVWWTA